MVVETLSGTTDLLTHNRYTYVNGDPINYHDPTGHERQIICDPESPDYDVCYDEADRLRDERLEEMGLPPMSDHVELREEPGKQEEIEVRLELAYSRYCIGLYCGWRRRRSSTGSTRP